MTGKSLSADPADVLSSRPYLAAVRGFADTVLEHGRDTYSEQRTPLFVDGLHIQTLQPVIWQWSGGRTWVMCNLANQQALMRLLDGLTGLTGEAKYRQAAEAAMGYAMTHLLTPNGLLYWGGHTAWDLRSQTPVGTRIDDNALFHELKDNQPYFELMWRLNPQATARLLPQIWTSHIVDWANLDFNRHGTMKESIPLPWDAPFDETGPVPFATHGDHLSFTGAVPPLLRSLTMLAVLGRHDQARTWVRRMMHQWQRAKHPVTGLCGGQVSWRISHDRAIDALQHAYPTINEANIVASYHMIGRYYRLTLAQMQAGESLIAAGGRNADLGREFVAWAADDLKRFTQCYDSARGAFMPMMTDGTPIDSRQVKPGYYVPGNFLPTPPNGWILWAYAMAYRLTGDRDLWPMLRTLGGQLGLGEFGSADGDGRSLAQTTRSRHRCLIHAMIELARATGDENFLRPACRVADNLIRLQTSTGLFPRPAYDEQPGTVVFHGYEDSHRHMPARVYARTGDEIPLTLLHLAAAIEGRHDRMPQAVNDSQYFHCPFKGPLEPYQMKRADPRTYDWLAFYGPSEVASPADA